MKHCRERGTSPWRSDAAAMSRADPAALAKGKCCWRQTTCVGSGSGKWPQRSPKKARRAGAGNPQSVMNSYLAVQRELFRNGRPALPTKTLSKVAKSAPRSFIEKHGPDLPPFTAPAGAGSPLIINEKCDIITLFLITSSLQVRTMEARN